MLLGEVAGLGGGEDVGELVGFGLGLEFGLEGIEGVGLGWFEDGFWGFRVLLFLRMFAFIFDC